MVEFPYVEERGQNSKPRTQTYQQCNFGSKKEELSSKKEKRSCRNKLETLAEFLLKMNFCFVEDGERR